MPCSLDKRCGRSSVAAARLVGLVCRLRCRRRLGRARPCGMPWTPSLQHGGRDSAMGQAYLSGFFFRHRCSPVLAPTGIFAPASQSDMRSVPLCRWPDVDPALLRYSIAPDQPRDWKLKSSPFERPPASGRRQSASGPGLIRVCLKSPYRQLQRSCVAQLRAKRWRLSFFTPAAFGIAPTPSTCVWLPSRYSTGFLRRPNAASETDFIDQSHH